MKLLKNISVKSNEYIFILNDVVKVIDYLLRFLLLVVSPMLLFSLIGLYANFLSNLLCSYWTVSIVEFGGIIQPSVCHVLHVL